MSTPLEPPNAIAPELEVSLAAVARTGSLPATAEQERFWFLANLHPDATTYHVRINYRLKGPLEIEWLRSALTAVVNRHESLRTTLAVEAGVPVQVIGPPVEWKLDAVDVRNHPDPEDEALRLAGAEFVRPFDLSKGPLFRTRLIRIGPDDYLFGLVFHHAIWDGWSYRVFLDDLRAGYAACSRGDSPTLSPLPIQPVDFAVWQRRWLASAEGQRQLTYWKQQLGDAPPVLELPTDRARPLTLGFQGGLVKFPLPHELGAKILEIARVERTTRFVVLLAAYNLLLSRLSGVHDQVVGTTVVNRGRGMLVRKELAGVIGSFANSVAVRTKLDGAQPFRDAVQRTKNAMRGAVDNHDVPFHLVVELVQPKRDPSRTPIYQAMFAVEDHASRMLPLADVDVSGHRTRSDASTDAAMVDLLLKIATRGDQLDGYLEYDAALFERSTIERFAEQFQVLLTNALAQPDVGIDALPMMSAAERTRVLVDWNATSQDSPAAQTVHALVGAQVARTPDAIAVEDETVHLSYRELEARAERVAGWLASQGVGRGARVAVSLERTADMVAALLGVMKAGAAYVPIDPSFPESRRAFIRADSGAAVDLTDVTLREAFALSAPAPRVDVVGEDVAYVLYTSGSTGQPKGVMVPHGAVVNFLASMRREPGMTSSDTLVAVTTLSFDIAGLELYLPLIVGAKVVLASTEVASDGVLLAALLAASGATVLQATPATFRLLVTGGWRPSKRLRILCGGESLPADLATTLATDAGALWNMYGPTETTIWSTCAKVEPGQPITIGTPIGNTRVYVVDAALRPTPIGVPGELCIGGAGVALGYHRRPELTAEKFVDDPFAREPRARMFRTGDRARWLANGTLEHLGRLDHQVKLRGYRIELGEIEAVLIDSKLVREAVVVVREDTPGDPRLVAYVVSVGPAQVDRLRTLLKATLPDYMVPSAFVVLDALPLTPNLKVDRRALPAPDRAAHVATGYVAARTPIEEILIGIWSELLRVPAIGVRDDFFALGGHSLLAMRLVSQVRAHFGADLALRRVFETPTVEGLAREVERLQAGGELAVAPPLVARPRGERPPLSYAQQRMWFLHQLDPASAAYHIPSARRLRGPLDAEALRRAFEDLVNRHEALRTVFPSPDGSPYQQITPAGRRELAIDDLRGLDETTRESELARIGAAHADDPFDLGTGPLLRTRLVRLGEQDHVLLETMHHIVSDGWSLGVLWDELSVLYAAHQRGESAQLPALAVQYVDYAAWQRNWLQGDELGRQLAYWKDHLHGAPEEIALPFRGSRPPVQTFRGRYHSVELDPELSTRLRALARRQGATLFMTLLAGFRALLFRYTGQDDLVIGTPIANRNRGEIDGLVGLFVNTLALRNHVRGDEPFAALLAREKQIALSAYDHQETPFEMVVDAIEVARSLSRSPLFQVMYSHVSATATADSLDGLAVERLPAGATTAKFDLSMESWEAADRLGASFLYNVDLLDERMVAQMARHYVALLDQVCGDATESIAQVPLLDAEERQRVVGEWNATDPPTDPELVTLRFEAQVDRTPDAIAVVFETESLTYRRLDARANQLAHELIASGVRRDEPVGVLSERNPDLLVSVLAILKAGAAFVPLDPTYPSDRLHAILTDSRARHVVGHSRWADLIHETDVRWTWLDQGHAVSAQPTTRPNVAISGTNLAYVLFTSGSTGRPKGVMIEHLGLANYLGFCLDAYPVHTGHGVPVHSSLAFDLTVTSIFAPLLTGLTVHLVREGLGLDALVSAVTSQPRMSVLKLTPTHLDLLAMSITPAQAAGVASCLIVGGEQLYEGQLEFWRRHAPDMVVFNEYGPTETVVGCCVHRADAVGSGSGAVPIGRPLPGNALYVLAPSLAPVPLGVAGDLYIGGVQLARGYVGRPDLTAERFVPDPYGPPGSRMYRTGDVARGGADRALEFLGRSDHQVKLRGFRIELGEIESALVSHPAVAQSVIVLSEGTSKRLVAYVVPATTGGLALAELRAHAAKSLPEYMVPAAFIVLDSLPLTSSGKVDRKALPAPTDDAFEHQRYVAPRSRVESTLVDLWRELLGVEQVGVHDNFFALGGDSIMSIQLLTRARRAGLSLTARSIFQHQTIAEMAADAGPGETTVDAEQGEVTGQAPLTPIQRSFFATAPADPHRFTMATVVEVDERVDVDVLARSLVALAAHHDALRLRFDRGDGGWRQRFTGTAASSVSLDVQQTSKATPADVQELVRAANVAAHDALDVATGPMLAARYLDLGAGPGRLVLVAHHLIIDQVSWSILLDDLERVYRQLERGEPVSLDAKTTSFKRWSERLAELGSAPERLADVAHWRALAEFVPQRIPIDHERGEMTVSSTRGLTVSLDTDVTRRLLADAPAAYRTQVNDVLLTALGEAFSAWAGVDRLLVALEGHGREPLFDDVDLSRTVGWFTSMFPVALVRDGADLGRSLKATKEALRRIPNRGIGYGIHRELGDDAELRAALAAAPIPQITFNYLGQTSAGQMAAADRATFRASAESAPQLWDPRLPQTSLFVVNCWVSEGRLQCAWSFSEARHRRETIEALATAFVGALERLVEHCTSPEHFGYTPSDFPLAGLDQAELDALIGGRSDVEDVYPLTPVQAGILFHSLQDERSGVYVVQQVFSISGLDREALAAAFAALIERHSIFRTYVAWESLLQVVVREHDFSLAEHDRLGDLDAFLREDRLRGFDLATAPLMRATLLRTGEHSGELVWTTHHLVTDGWSGGQVRADFLELYGAAREGRTASLPPIPRFRDYIAWLSSRAPDETQAFWRGRLAGFAAPTPLPIAGAFESTTDTVHTGELQRRVFGLGRRLERAAKRHHTTASTLVHAAWGLLLVRYTGEDDVVFGSVVSGRNAEIPGIEHMVGMLINTVPVRIVVGPHERISELLARLHDDLSRSRAYEHLSLIDAQRFSSVPAGTPLFHTLLAYENYLVDPGEAAGRTALGVTGVRGVEQTSYPLDISVTPGDDLSLVVHYNQRLFTDAQIGQIVDHFIRLLAGLAPEVGAEAGRGRSTDLAVAEIELLDAAEHAQLAAWNDTARDVEREPFVVGMIEAQVDLSPDAAALTFEGASLTYRELDARVNQLAHHLLAAGAGRGRTIGVRLERSPAMVISVLAILKTGAAYVPIDPAYPEARVRAIREASGCVLVVDDAWLAAHAGGSTARPGVALDGHDAAYVLFTSGSTGTPKGAVIEHAGLRNRLLWPHAFGFTAADRFVLKTPFTFDVSVFELLYAFVVGGCLVIAAPDGHRDPQYLAALIRDERVTYAHFVPSMLGPFVEAARTTPCPTLRRVICSGEALPAALVRDAVQVLDAELYNLYGPTEATVDVSWWRCDPASRIVPIGVAAPNTRLYVLDRHLQQAPIGVAGELYLAGIQLARGYASRPDLTAERFVPDPFLPGERMYRTGDLARFLPDGAVEYLGRLDHQVKLRGLRIELGEIEAVLRTHAAVGDAAVIVREDTLVAYIVPRVAGAAIANDALQATLRAALPEYMVPAVFVPLTALPLTSSGKLDRKALPAPELRAATGYVAPRDDVEATLAQLCCDLLHVERIGIHDDFFALGGHSLLAMRVVSRVRKLFAVELALRSLFDAPTVEGLAREVARLRARDESAAAPPLVSVPRDGALVASFGQERFWLLAQIAEHDAYDLSRAVRIRGALDTAALSRAVDALVARHEPLRTTLAEVDGRVVQIIAPARAGLLATVEVESLEAGCRYCNEALRRPYDLTAGPLFVPALVRIDAEDHVLLLRIHHAISDEWSMDILWSELGALYRGEKLAPLAVQYADFAAWQRSWLVGDVLERQLAYWRGRLAGGEPLELPTDRPRAAVLGNSGGVVTRRLPVELGRAMEALGRTHGTTPFMTYLSAFYVLLYRYSHQHDLSVGTPVANRGRAETDALIGYFLNTVVLRADLEGNPSFASLLEQVRSVALDAYANQNAPFERVVEALRVPREGGRSPLFQAMFVHQRAAGGDGDGRWEPTLALGPLPQVAAEARAKFELMLAVFEGADGVSCALEFNTELYERATIERMLAHFELLLEGIIAEPTRPVGALPLLSPSEQQQLVEWNDTARDVEREPFVVGMIEAQVDLSPDAAALTFEGASLTYRELDARVNQLAHHLIAAGAVRGRTIGVRLERSPAMVISVFAILKTGAAYVPIDPAYPDARVHAIREASGCVLVVDDAWLAAHAGGSTARPGVALDGHDAAYVLFTSGSTGTPKGAVIEHAGLRNRLLWPHAFGFTAADRFVLKTPFTFDVSVFELLYAFVVGGCLVIAAPDGHRDPQYLAALIRDERVTYAHFVPSMLGPFVEAARTTPCPTLRRVICSGEALPAALVRDAVQVLDADLYNLYGPTEATVDVSWWRCDPASRIVPIGVAAPNTRLYVLDRDLQQAPIGVAGELYLAGIQLARGYAGRPDLTAERFVPDPFLPGERMYRTGDLARFLPDGAVEYLGRLDHQVKLRGLRIELGEIEVVLRTHAAVGDAAVIVREDTLVAYIVPRVAGAVIANDALQATLRAALPEYMVPAVFVPLTALPLTSSGKLDRKALPAPDMASMQQAYIGPRTEAERVLAEIWCELLGLERVGVHDNFFTLGGHSLLAVRVIAALRRHGLALEVRTLFAAPTLEHVAASVRRMDEVKVPPNAIDVGTKSITPSQLPLITLTQPEIDTVIASVLGGVSNIQDIYALTPLQEGMLFHHQLSTEGDTYLLVGRMAFSNRALVDRYLAALQRVVDRHDVLRTSLCWDGLSTPAQVVWRSAPLHVTEEVLEGTGPGAFATLAAKYDPRHYRIDLTRAPLMQIVLAKEPGIERWFVIELWHHVINDHESLALMRAEIGAFITGRMHELVPSRPFRNLVAQARLGQLGEPEHERYFRSQLGDIEEPTAPFGILDAHRDGRGVVESHVPLTPGLTDELRSQARQLGLSVAVLFHVAWGQVLARTSGREATVFGTVLFGRMNAAGGEQALGLYMNTLPIRIDLDATGVEATVRKAQATLAELMRHEHAPLGLAQRCSGVAAPAPLFTALLNYRRDMGDPAGGVDVEKRAVEWLGGEERTNYPCVLSVNDNGTDLSLGVQVSEQLSAERVSAMMMRALEQLAHALAHAPQTPVRTLDILPPAERQQVLVDWNATSQDYPRDATLHDLFEAQVDRAPDAIAVVCEGEQLTYRALDERANQLALHLRTLGVGPEVRVALCMHRSAETLVGLLGILKAGGAYVPIEPSTPSERIAFTVEDSGCRVAVVNADLADLATRAGMEVVCIEAMRDLLDRGPCPRLRRPARASDLAYVIYTSGSTGRPKGVMIEHGMAVNVVLGMGELEHITPGDRVLQFASFAFDLSVQDIFVALSRGATIVMRGDAIPSPAELYGPQFTGVTVMNLPAAYWHTLATAGPPPPSLRLVGIGGERPSSVHVRAWCELAPRCVLLNCYGPTEATITATAWQLRGEALGREVPIGRPLPNYVAYVLDAHLRLVPVGVTGELYLGGASIARGYLERPALTAEHFIANPFVEGRLYRTGDLVRRLPDGDLEYLGRIDHQVKVRGYRIELGEIDHVLGTDPSVQQAVVVVHDDRLVAYVVPRDGFDASAVRTRIGTQLPDYMIPAVFVALDAFPLTANGKLDRRALPVPDLTSSEAYVPPRTEQEAALAQLWSELLGVERVGVHDDFFALGGHSLLAIRLVAGVERRFGVRIPLRDLFVDSTLGGLAARVGHARASDSSVERPTLYPSAIRRTRLPAALRGVFKLNKSKASNQLSRHAWSAWIEGPLEISSLERALAAMRERHALLRTRFFADDKLEMLEVLDPFDVERFALLERADLSSLSAEDQASADAEFHQSVCFRPLDVGRGEVMSVALSRWSATRHHLTVSLHNIVSDADTMTVYMNELCDLWRDPAAVLPPVSLQYHHLADYLERMRESEAGRAQRAFWTARLEGIEPLRLPVDLPREEVDARREASDGVVTFRSGSVERVLSKEAVTAIERSAESQRASVMSTLVAAMAAHLSQLTSQRDVAFITRLSQRYLPGLERSLGFLVNPIVLRISTEGEPAFSELVGRTHAVVNDAFDHGECDLFEIAPYHVFRFCLVYIRTAAVGEGSRLLPNGSVATRVTPPRAAERQMGYDLLLWLTHDDGCIRLDLEYNLELFRDPTAAAFLEGYVDYVTAACKAS